MLEDDVTVVVMVCDACGYPTLGKGLCALCEAEDIFASDPAA